MAKAFSGLKSLLASAAVLPYLHGAASFAADPKTAPDATTDVQEVVVTATRQSQSLSKVPESVSAFTAAKMDAQGIKSFADLAKFTPGVTFNEDRHDVSIRGIDSKAGSGPTGIYIDDTPIQMRALGLNANNTLPAVFDLERVEVLRGPQGTLFGAGSEGGTVRYITTQPSLSKFSALAHAEVADTQGGSPSYELGAAAGGPIVKDVLGFRVSAWARRDGGWVDRNNGDDVGRVDKNANRTDTYVLRGALTWAPTSTLSLTPTINYEKRDQHNHDEYWVSASNPNAGVYVSGTPDRQADSDRFFMPTLKAEWDAGPVKVISNTSYYDRNERVNGYSGTLYNLSYFEHFTTAGTDPQGSSCSTASCTSGQSLLTSTGLNISGFGAYVAYNYITNIQKNFNQEFRIQSNDPSARLNWVTGVFFAYDSQRSKEEIYDPQLAALTEYLFGEDLVTAWGENLLSNGDDYINDTTSHDRQIALFADGTFSITTQFKLTAGLRYAWTHFDYHNLNDGPQDLLDNGGVPSTASGGKDETPLTPKVGLSYQVTPDDMVYTTVSKGYRIGGASPPIPAAACGQSSPSSYNSDTVMSYEVGSKDRFFDRKLSLSGSLYYIDWKNIQQAVYVQQCGIQYTTNLGSAVSQGFDLEGQWQVTQGLEVEMTVGYTDAHYTHNADSPIDQSRLVTKGDALDVAPWTVTPWAQYNFQVRDHEAFIRGDYEYTGNRTRATPDEDPTTSQYDSGLKPNPAVTQVSARAGFSLAHMDLALYVNNLFDAHPQLDLQHQDSSTALYEATTIRPRTIGLSASYKY